MWWYNILAVSFRARVGDEGIVCVELNIKRKDGLLGIPCVCALQGLQVCVLEDEHRLVLEGSVHQPELIVHVALLLVFLKDALLLTKRCTCWDGCRYSWVGRANEGGGHDTRVLIGWKDDTELSVLIATEGALYWLHFCCQELVDLLDGCVVRLERVLG